MTTRARDFKFAGTPVQRLQLAMVALTQKSFSAQYAWFSRGGSHMVSLVACCVNVFLELDIKFKEIMDHTYKGQ